MIAGLILALIPFALVPFHGANLGPGADPAGSVFYFATMGAVFGAVVGAVPGALVMILSRARFHPWRAIPVLLCGTTIGFFVAVGPLMMFEGTDLVTVLVDVGAIAGPTIGGLIAGRFLPPVAPGVA